jgi:hypothetical protein
MALIAPFIIAAFLGVVDAGLALQKYRQAVQAASSIAHTAVDLSVRDARSSPDSRSMVASRAANEALTKGFGLTLGDASLRTSTAHAARMVRNRTNERVWTWTYSGGGRLPGETDVDETAINTSSLPAMQDGESVIMVEVAYNHSFLFMPGSVRISSRYYALVPPY